MRIAQSEQGHDHGQAAVFLVVIATTLFVLMISSLSILGGRALDRVQAQSAADAAALASLDAGLPGAQSMALEHGAVVVSWRQGPGLDEVTVVLRIGDVTAIASATNAP
jgi:hypothetical protein